MESFIGFFLMAPKLWNCILFPRISKYLAIMQTKINRTTIQVCFTFLLRSHILTMSTVPNSSFPIQTHWGFQSVLDSSFSCSKFKRRREWRRGWILLGSLIKGWGSLSEKPETEFQLSKLVGSMVTSALLDKFDWTAIKLGTLQVLRVMMIRTLTILLMRTMMRINVQRRQKSQKLCDNFEKWVGGSSRGREVSIQDRFATKWKYFRLCFRQGLFFSIQLQLLDFEKVNWTLFLFFVELVEILNWWRFRMHFNGFCKTLLCQYIPDICHRNHRCTRGRKKSVMWRNFKYLYICHVEKSEISPKSSCGDN